MKLICYLKFQDFPDEGEGALSAGNAKAALVLPDNYSLQIESRKDG
jgi:hypothetical protein